MDASLNKEPKLVREGQFLIYGWPNKNSQTNSVNDDKFVE